MNYTGGIEMGYNARLTLAALWVIITEGAVWLALYIAYCQRKKRLPFGKLRVVAFKWLMRHTDDAEWRIRWATLCFGREGNYAAKCAVCLQKLDRKLSAASAIPDEVA